MRTDRVWLRQIGEVDDIARGIAANVRAEMARAKVHQTALSRDVFHPHPQQWVNRRTQGDVAFSGAELALIAEYLEIPVERFYVLPRHDSNVQPFDKRTAPLRLVAEAA